MSREQNPLTHPGNLNITVEKHPSSPDELNTFDYRFLLYLAEREELTTLNGFYHYKTRPYEGSGVFIAWTDNGWILHDMTHCSCYGPLDHITDTHPTYHTTLTNLLEAHKGSWPPHLEDLCLHAASNGYT